LKAMIEHCFESQKVYGKEPEQIAATVKMFQLVLGEYSYEKVRAAFIYYLKRNSEMPAPADICKLIEGEGKPIMDKATYIGIKKRMENPSEYIMPKEREYVKEFEKTNIYGYQL